MSYNHGRVSKYRGVSWHQRSQKWYSSITVKGTVYNCGYHDDEREAAKSRDRKIIALNLNRPLQVLKKVDR